MKSSDLEKALPLYNELLSLNTESRALTVFADALPIESTVNIQINNKVAGTIKIEGITGSFGHVLIESLLDHKREKINQIKSEFESI